VTEIPPSGHALETPAHAAPSPRGPRARYIVAGLVCVAAIVYLVVVGLGSNIVYFRTPTEAVANRASEGNHRFRLAGAVVPGSVHQTATGVDFTLTDDRTRVTVHHDGDTPALFKDGVPVVCEGHWSGNDAFFASDRILIKHDGTYTPKQQVHSVTTVTVEPQG